MLVGFVLKGIEGEEKGRAAVHALACFTLAGILKFTETELSGRGAPMGMRIKYQLSFQTLLNMKYCNLVESLHFVLFLSKHTQFR